MNTIENSSDFEKRKAFAKGLARAYSLKGGSKLESSSVYLCPSDLLPVDELRKLIYDQGYNTSVIKHLGKYAVSILKERSKKEGENKQW